MSGNNKKEHALMTHPCPAADDDREENSPGRIQAGKGSPVPGSEGKVFGLEEGQEPASVGEVPPRAEQQQDKWDQG